MVLISISLSLAFALTSMLAWDFGRRWIDEQAKRRVADATLAQLLDKVGLHDSVIDKLATDWRAKFAELERRIETELQSQARSPGVPPPIRGFNR